MTQFVEPDLLVRIVQPIKPEVREIPSEDITYFIGDLEDSVTTSQRNTIFLAHDFVYGQPYSGYVKKLTFLHIGSEKFIPRLFELYQYVSSVEFCGHIASTDVFFGIIKQLKRVKTITVFIGSLQQVEHYVPLRAMKSSKSRSVKTLKIILDPNYFYSSQHTLNSSIWDAYYSADSSKNFLQRSLIHLTESLVIRGSASFPNLEHLDVVWSEHDLEKQFQIRSSWQLEKKAKLGIQQVPRVDERNQAYGDGSHSGTVPHFQPLSYHGPNYLSPTSLLFNNNDHSSHQIQADGCSNIGSRYFPTLRQPRRRSRPPRFTPLPTIPEEEENTTFPNGLGQLNWLEHLNMHERVSGWLNHI